MLSSMAPYRKARSQEVVNDLFVYLLHRCHYSDDKHSFTSCILLCESGLRTWAWCSDRYSPNVQQRDDVKRNERPGWIILPMVLYFRKQNQLSLGTPAERTLCSTL